MKYTSAQAAKILRKLNEDVNSVISMENQSKTFLAALGEDVESVRPEYSFSETQKTIEELNERIRRVKHAISVFNCTTVVPGFDMTVDQMLVLIPQLTRDKNRLYGMKNVLPMTRVSTAGFGKTSAVIDYRYANYDISETEKEYERVSDLLARAQTALDTLNNSELLEIDI